MPGKNQNQREEELDNIRQWATENNLKLNENKSVEFDRKRSKNQINNLPTIKRQ